MTTSATLSFEDRDAFGQLCGPNDQHLKILEELLRVSVVTRGNTVQVGGEGHDVEVASAALTQFYDLAHQGYRVFPSDIPRGLRILSSAPGTRIADVFLDTIFVASGKRRISPKNLGQKRYIDAMRNQDLTFGIGAAGTGKTYLAMAMGVQLLLARGNALLVRDVVVDGRTIVREGKVVGVDLDAIERELQGMYRDGVRQFGGLERAWELLEGALGGWLR